MTLPIPAPRPHLRLSLDVAQPITNGCLDDILRLLRDHGFKQGALSPQHERLDGEIARATLCLSCGSECDYIPLRSAGAHFTSRAFAICTKPECGRVDEF